MTDKAGQARARETVTFQHTIEDIRRIAAMRAETDGLAERVSAYRDRAPSPVEFDAIAHGVWPTLHLEDVSAIPFVAVIPGVERYQHRARVRATDGDLFAAVTPIPEGYEAYCREFLGLGSPDLVPAEPVAGPMAVIRACRHGAAFDQVTAWAQGRPGVAIHPYMAIEDAWALATEVTRASGTPARVVGPPPPVLWVANDKWALTELIREVVGEEFVVESRRAYDVETLGEILRDFARRHETVGLKRTRCASAMGNVVFDASKLRRMPPPEVDAEVEAFLRDTEWEGDEEVIVVAWIRTDLSPSTQCWLPPAASGKAPLVEGVYEQLLEGRERVFVGSRPSTLPDAVNAVLAQASLRLATALQTMGYVGRCSFDFVVSGDLESPAGFSAQFTECNGRWGGTSTPMYLVDRLIGRPRPPYLAQDYVHEALVGATFDDVRAALSDELYDPKTGQGRFILYNLGPLEHAGKFDVISLGRTSEEALEGVARIIPDRLGLS